MAHTIYKNDKGKRLKSVTTIIGNNLGWKTGALIGWNLKLVDQGLNPRAELKKAGQIGTLAHNMVEQFIKGGSVILDGYEAEVISKAKIAYYGFYNWFADNNVEFYETELKLVSDQYQFGGTFDAICEVNGKLVICDWKTSNSTYPEFLIQLGAYRQLIQENLDHDIRGAILLRLDKEEKGVYEEHHYKIKDLHWGWKMFKLLLKIQENKR